MKNKKEEGRREKETRRGRTKKKQEYRYGLGL